MRSLARCCFLFVLLLSFKQAPASLAQRSDGYQVVHTYPHDAQAFTQGLVYMDGHLYESTGLVGKSSLRSEEAESGRILQFHDVPSPIFAEGLTDWGDTLIQLTWQNHSVLVYDRASFRLLRTLPYSGDGWGVTHDSKSLILSDGSATLHFIDPTNLRELRKVTVKDHGKPISQLNELEYIHGEVFANIWHSDRIARIDPETGRVLGWIDLSGLLSKAEHPDAEAVLNGIAYDAQHDLIFVTGKLWPKIFAIRLIDRKVKSSLALSAH